MTVTGTHVKYFFICKRKLWLFANGISMEHTSQAVAEGMLIGKTSYAQRPDRYKEIEIGGSKIDFYDVHEKVVHEIKKSNSVEEAHEWQVKFYIWLLRQNGISDVTGLLEYPKLRETKQVILTAADEAILLQVVNNIIGVVEKESCPAIIHSPICKKCAYYDFCYINE